MTGQTISPSRRPVIGLTMDSEEPGGYSKFPWLALRLNYAGSVTRAGGLPFPLPPVDFHASVDGPASKDGKDGEPPLITEFLSRIDGLIVTGGAFDVDPALFGEAEKHASVTTKDRRTRFEFALIRGALARDMPVLGICGGQQLLHVVLGGKLIQHIPDAVPNALAHEQPTPRDEPGHDIDILEGSLLHRLTGTTKMAVNSAHHQAVLGGPGNIPDGVIVNCHAPDGVVEGIEAPEKRFCLGVQWHPEFFISEGDHAILEALIREAAAWRAEQT